MTRTPGTVRTCFEIICLALREYTVGRGDREKLLTPGVFTRG